MKNNKTNEKVKPKPKKTGVKLLSDEKYFSNDKIKSDEVRIIETYLKSDGKPLKIFAGLFKGHYSKLILSAIFFIIKNAHFWVVPVITANLIDLVVKPTENTTTLFIINQQFCHKI